MTDSHLKTAFAAFFNPRTIVPFLIGALFLSVLGNATYQLLTNLFGTQNSSVLIVIAITALGFVLSMLAFVWQAKRPGAVVPLPHPLRQRPRSRKGLIFLFSRPEVAREAIKAHEASLQRLWLICTPQKNAEANAFAGELQTVGQLAVEVRVVEDANDPLAFHETVSKVLRERPAGWAVDDVIADYVGLTSHASIGMVLACLHEQAPVQYTPAEYDANLKPIRPLPPFEVILQGRRAPSS
jgi:hypothetical protein